MRNKVIWIFLIVSILFLIPSITLAEDAVLLEHTVFSGRDPFTPPQTKVDYVNSSIPGIKAPRVRHKWMYSKLLIRISGPNDDKIKNVISSCFQEAVSAGLVVSIATAVTTGGLALPAATNTFSSYVQTCLTNRLPSTLINISFPNPTHWGDWE